MSVPYWVYLHWENLLVYLREGTTNMVFSQKTKIRILVNMSVFKRYGNGWG